MASVTKVDGKWRALVRRKGHKTKCKTFPAGTSKAKADAWGVEREAELDGAGDGPVLGALTVADVIRA